MGQWKEANQWGVGQVHARQQAWPEGGQVSEKKEQLMQDMGRDEEGSTRLQESVEMTEERNKEERRRARLRKRTGDEGLCPEPPPSSQKAGAAGVAQFWRFQQVWWSRLLLRAAFRVVFFFTALWLTFLLCAAHLLLLLQRPSSQVRVFCGSYGSRCSR